MVRRRKRKPGAGATKFSWREHPVGRFAKILVWLVATTKADDAALAAGASFKAFGITAQWLWSEVVEKRMPYLPELWLEETGRPLESGTLHNRLFYMYREHRKAGGAGRLVKTLSGEHPTRSLRLKPYLPGVRICFERIDREIPRDLAEWVCSEPAPSVDDVLAKL